MANDGSQNRDLNRFIIRFPTGMREQIANAAKESGRSMNSEIVFRLARSFVGYLGGTPEQDEAHIDALVQGFVYKSDEPIEQLAAREVALVAALTERLAVAASSLKHTMELGQQKKTPKAKKKPAKR